MVFNKVLDHAIEHRHALLFAGGIATAIIGKKILESQAVKDATTNCVAGALSIKQDAEAKVEEIKADVEAKVEEA